jgi:hypothetical protein
MDAKKIVKAVRLESEVEVVTSDEITGEDELPRKVPTTTGSHDDVSELRIKSWGFHRVFILSSNTSFNKHENRCRWD